MIRMIQNQCAAQAKAYFNDSLQKGDYYLDGQERAGFGLHGKIAGRMGIGDHPTKDVFHMLCENIHPITGDKLTLRNQANRTIGYDINFHCPKSVSVLHVMTGDAHIVDVFQHSVLQTMRDIEADAQTRVRKNNADENRPTGELLWAEFIHHTARPEPGYLPDPHLHSHCFVFNVTWDGVEQRFKAAQFRDIKRDMPYYQALFHKRLADGLQGLGYKVRRTKTAFEITDVPDAAIRLFSKRSNAIGQFAKEHGITDARVLDNLGAMTRAKKQKGLTMESLQQSWRQQLDEAGLAGLITPVLGLPQIITPSQAIDFALAHCFERFSVVPERTVLAAAVRYCIGSVSVSSEAVQRCFEERIDILRIREHGTVLCTTAEVLAEEQHMVSLAQQGKGRFLPLYRTLPTINLTGDQHRAVAHILSATHQVSIVQGGAGTGKTTLMKEAVRLLNETGKKVFVVAPTANAARDVLRGEGFADADTVATLLGDTVRQKDLRNNVLWVDEAGLLGTSDMTALLELVTAQDARLILSGDTRQHASVVRGDALRILNVVAGIQYAAVNRIFRQKSEQYKEAVNALALGDASKAFDYLDTLHAFKAIDHRNPYDETVTDYFAKTARGKTGLIVSPTHAACEAVTDALRLALKEQARIGPDDTIVKRFKPLNLTQAEKTDAVQYRAGLFIQFTQHTKAAKKSSVWEITAVNENALVVENTQGKNSVVPFALANCFEVYEQKPLALAENEIITITRNGFDSDHRRLNNGQVLQIVRMDEDGFILAKTVGGITTYRLSESFGHWAHGYCITSHAAQGKTVDHVFVIQPADTFAASDLKQFYVSVSRARESVQVYTDDKDGLFERVREMRHRQSATELLHLHTLIAQRNMEQPKHLPQPEPEPHADIPAQYPATIAPYVPG